MDLEEIGKKIIAFFTGSILVCLLTIIQEKFLGHNLNLSSFIVPFFYGGVALTIIYHLIQRRYKEEVNLKEVKYQELFNHINSGVAIYKPINDGNDFIFLDINQAGQRIDKINKEEILGKSIQEVFPMIRDFGLFEVMQRVYHTGNFESLSVTKYRDYRIEGYRENFVYKLPSGEIAAVYSDVTDRKEKENEIQTQKEELYASYEELEAYNEEVLALNEELEGSLQEINNLNERFVYMIDVVSRLDRLSANPEEEFLSELLKMATDIIPEADYGKIFIIEDNKCRFVETIGHNLTLLKKITIDKNMLFHNNEQGIHNSLNYSINLEKIPERSKELFMKALKPIKESIYLNIYFNKEIVGRITLDIAENSNKTFSNTTKHILQSLSSLISAFFAFQKYNQLEDTFVRDIVLATIKLLEIHDNYTSGHSENVAKLTLKIAQEMDLPDKELNDAYWSGMIHDIGKLLVPLRILNKKGHLSEEEYDIIQNHPYWAYLALSNSKTLTNIAKYIRCHHERWDGKGYPEGLKGKDIPIISQILVVADSWDAMTSTRAYRKPLSKKEALKEITQNKGTQFAPDIVDIFLKLFERGV